MRILYSKKFEKTYRGLTPRVKMLAEKKERIFRKNPFDARLKTHKLSGPLNQYWSFAIDRRHRIIFLFAGDETVWFLYVGNHSIYR
ncbi:MAG: type II toxin-antitoxin system YoeB family toxin [Parcubacteria group bacterium]|nr:type II toxin-antitoxin system YoeB family toxin [Parcubacteria group bacterium]